MTPCTLRAGTVVGTSYILTHDQNLTQGLIHLILLATLPILQIGNPESKYKYNVAGSQGKYIAASGIQPWQSGWRATVSSQKQTNKQKQCQSGFWPYQPYELLTHNDISFFDDSATVLSGFMEVPLCGPRMWLSGGALTWSTWDPGF